MNLWCKLFGHKINIMDGSSVYELKVCTRPSCCTVVPGLEIPPMPKVKPVKSEYHKTAQSFLTLRLCMGGDLLDSRMILLTEKEMVELAETNPVSLTEIRELFGRK